MLCKKIIFQAPPINQSLLTLFKKKQYNMAKVNAETILAIRNTASHLDKSNQYQWGHMGACNCGFLVQEVLKMSKEEIHSKAMKGHGDWSEQLNDYCPNSGLPMDELIDKLLEVGFSRNDLKDLEKLSGKEVLEQLPLGDRNLKQNVKADVIKYLLTWATLLENQLLESIEIEIPQIESSVV
jgi:hypothetical protein